MKLYRPAIFSTVAAVLLFLWLNPYFAWSLSKYSFFLYTVPLIGIFWYYTPGIKQNDGIYLMVFICILLIAALSARSTFNGVISMVILSIIPFASSIFLIQTYRKFRNIYSVLILVSIIVWILVMSGFAIPYKMIAPLNNLKDYNYIAYPFLVTINPSSIEAITLNAFRFCGLFDEPGVVGTISMILLYIEKFDLRKKINIPILISGLLSMSLFFYLGASIYAMYYLIFVFRSVKKRILFLMVYVLLVAGSHQSEYINELIWNRVEWNMMDGGGLAGDNRADYELKTYYRSIVGTGEFWWGVGDRNVIEKFMGNAGYRNAIFIYGAMACLLYVIFFVLFAFFKIREGSFLLY
ncbi:MAG: hypothetical protein RR346_08690 [Bacteroidales bacterium]